MMLIVWKHIFLNYQGFEGNGDILQKFGVQTTDAVTFVYQKKDMKILLVHF